MSFELFYKNLTDFRKTVQTAVLDLHLKLFTSLSTAEKTCRGILTAVSHHLSNHHGSSFYSGDNLTGVASFSQCA